MKQHNRAEQPGTNEQDKIPSFQLYVILACGIIIILVGIYLTVNGQTAHGISLPDKTGQGGGRQITIIGPFAIGLGVAMGIFPAYFLIKQGIAKKKLKNN